MMHRSLIVALFATLTLLLSACTTTDPYTGEQVSDPGATAALVGGLALGAAAVAASSDDDDDRHEYHRHHNDYNRDNYRYNNYSPRSGVTCHDYTRICYKNGHVSKKWTRRTYGRDY